MKCNNCGREIVSEEIKGTLGMKVIYCCSEEQVDIDSLRPKAREAVVERNMDLWKLYIELKKG